MRAPDVVNAAAAGFWKSCSTPAAPIAMMAAAIQETAKMRMFVTRSGRYVNDYEPARVEIKPKLLTPKRSIGCPEGRPRGRVAAYFPRRSFDASFGKKSVECEFDHGESASIPLRHRACPGRKRPHTDGGRDERILRDIRHRSHRGDPRRQRYLASLAVWDGRFPVAKMENHRGYRPFSWWPCRSVSRCTQRTSRSRPPGHNRGP